MANQYIAITIGPILKTMEMASSPAALWASSYMFSYISKQLRQRLIDLPDHGISREAFISPYVGSENDILDRDDGLGLLHDHIIFKKPAGFTLETLKTIRDDVLADVNAVFQINDLPFLKKYIMIRAVEFSAENPIIGSGKMLDSIELPLPVVPKEETNPILSFFTSTNRKDARNQAIKKQGIEQLKIDPEKWQLLQKHPNASEEEKNSDRYWNYFVKDLSSIALGDAKSSSMKKHTYYAVVRSDGDNMGKLIARLSTTDEFHTFSEACLSYCEAISDKVKDYRGMTVYAGGDDLLAILPCDAGKDGRKTIFHFLREANQVFYDVFLEEHQPIRGIFDKINAQIEKADPKAGSLPAPSLTFGVTLCHCKYPLYEALADSADLLFGAKWKGYKNAVNIRLIKHSGQTSAVYLRNEVLGKPGEDSLFFRLLNRIVNNSQQEEADRAILSCLHTIREFGTLFRLANEKNTHDLFLNMFDADAHTGNEFLHQELPDLYVSHCLKKDSERGDGKKAQYPDEDICALDDHGYKVRYAVNNPAIKEEKEEEWPIDHAESLHYLLRILKFFVEKAGERE